jgi:hypothetical protein
MKQDRVRAMNWEHIAEEKAVENEQLKTKIRVLEAVIDELKEKIACLEKNSSTSSKPPSSDVVKPSKEPAEDHYHKKVKRKKGGQCGHPNYGIYCEKPRIFSL